jgi:hypothetical protein
VKRFTEAASVGASTVQNSPIEAGGIAGILQISARK